MRTRSPPLAMGRTSPASNRLTWGRPTKVCGTFGVCEVVGHVYRLWRKTFPKLICLFFVRACVILHVFRRSCACTGSCVGGWAVQVLWLMCVGVGVLCGGLASFTCLFSSYVRCDTRIFFLSAHMALRCVLVLRSPPPSSVPLSLAQPARRARAFASPPAAPSPAATPPCPRAASFPTCPTTW